MGLIGPAVLACIGYKQTNKFRHVQIYIDVFVQTRVRATDLRTEAVATVNISVINVNDWDPQVHVLTVQNTEIVFEQLKKNCEKFEHMQLSDDFIFVFGL